ncbi:MAG: N-acetylmuramoyl-L-alanine amidase [Silicimonas sp.]|nr:N-acetylmuramoyl-L-alanine amidase [Silicimonas sp.]
MSRLVLGICAAVASLVAGAVLADATPPARVLDKGARITETGGEVVISIDLSRAVGWRLWTVDGPPRVVLELSDFAWDREPELASTSIASLDILSTGPLKSEMHAFLREPLDIYRAEMSAREDGSAILEIRLRPTTAEAFRSELPVTPDKAGEAPKHLVVAIDSGHGGIDPGAQSGDLREADLVLDFAFRLRDVLLASGAFDVVLTRSDDTLVSLDERLSRARAAGAEVLLSLHADALEGSDSASGIVVYSLAGDAAGEANERLLERHGPEDRLSGVDLTDAGDDVSLALIDMARRDVIPRNAALSTALLNTFRSGELTLNTRPERAGDFAILKAADIPSVLIELGFLSTEDDLKRLTSEDWKGAAALAIRDGLRLWADEDRMK